jgi:hypothetical protein
MSRSCPERGREIAEKHGERGRRGSAGPRMRATHELLSNALQGQAWIEAVKVGDVTRDHERAFSSRDQNDRSVDHVGGSRAPAENTGGLGAWVREA